MGSTQLEASLESQNDSCHSDWASQPAGFHVPDARQSADDSDQELDGLLDRVRVELDGSGDSHGFVPKQPQSLKETGLIQEDVEKLVCKYLLARGSCSGRKISEHLGLPFGLLDGLLRTLKIELVLAYKNTAAAGDYEYILTDLGRERARRYSELCTYFGAAPVPLNDYIASVKSQSISDQQVTEVDLRQAFSDLVMETEMLGRLGPAINSGRGMFLYGSPGNGKTSIAERITRCLGSCIWVPRAIAVDGEIIRLFDPMIHEAVKEQNESILTLGKN